MKTIRSRFALCLALLLLLALARSEALAQHYAALTQSDSLSITDLVLIYQGGTHRLAWTSDHFLPYVSTTDRTSHREQWLFDGFLFIEFKDNRGFEYAHGYKQRPARKEEWMWLLQRNFERGIALEGLDRACISTAARIGPPLRKRKVVLTLPEPTVGQVDWGSLNGRELDFNRPDDRIAACKWYMDEALSLWNALSPENLDLAGFYWVAEYGSESKTILPRIGELVRSKGKRFYWIPYWNAPLAGEWKSLGFDAAYQQPNHFFHTEVSDDRLNEACAFARVHEMGLEMEFDGQAITAPRDFRPRFHSYLEFFRKNAVIDSSAIAYYEGGGVLLNLASSQAVEERALYDLLASALIARQHKADSVYSRRLHR